MNTNCGGGVIIFGYKSVNFFTSVVLPEPDKPVI